MRAGVRECAVSEKINIRRVRRARGVHALHTGYLLARPGLKRRCVLNTYGKYIVISRETQRTADGFNPRAFIMYVRP